MSSELSRRGLLGLLAAFPIFGRCREEGPPSFELVPQPIAGQQLGRSLRGGHSLHRDSTRTFSAP